MEFVLVWLAITLAGPVLDYLSKGYPNIDTRTAGAMVVTWAAIATLATGVALLVHSWLPEDGALAATILWALFCGYLGHLVALIIYQCIQRRRWRRAWRRLQREKCSD